MLTGILLSCNCKEDLRVHTTPPFSKKRSAHFLSKKRTLTFLEKMEPYELMNNVKLIIQLNGVRMAPVVQYMLVIPFDIYVKVHETIS